MAGDEEVDPKEVSQRKYSKNKGKMTKRTIFSGFFDEFIT